MPSDKRKPIPPAANALVDEAKMNIAEQLSYLRKVMKGGLSYDEIYRNLCQVTDLSYRATLALMQAQCIGKK